MPVAPAATVELILVAIEGELREIKQLLGGGAPARARERGGVVVTLPFPTDALKMWRTPVDATAKEIMRSNPGRIALIVFNAGVIIVDVGVDEQGVQGNESFPLAGGSSLALDNYTGAVWAREATGAGVTVAILEMSQ